MAAKYCLYFNNGINFHYSGPAFCNKLKNKDSFFEYKENYLENFLKKREEMINDMKSGKAPDDCIGCMYLKDVDDYSQINNKFSYIEIYHWNECNCACVYCSNRETTKLKITEKRNVKGVIELLPVLKDLKKRDLLAEDTEISMVGGEPTLLKEFKGLLKFFIKNNFKVNILSNGILYEKYIPKMLKTNNQSFLSISLDCGTREAFKKLKGVDKFDDVIKNIKHYIKDSKDSGSRIMIKYIILKGLNDNKDEIDKFTDICSSIGVTNYFPSIEFCHAVKDPNKIEIDEEICNLYKYFKERVKQVNENYQISTYDFVEKMIENHSYNIR